MLNADFLTFINVLGLPTVSFLSHFSEQRLKNFNKLVFIFHERKATQGKRKSEQDTKKNRMKTTLLAAEGQWTARQSLSGGKLKRDGKGIR